jgi:hypothetical protein
MSHAPAEWQSSIATHVTAVPKQVPAEQASLCVQGLPSLHAVAFILMVHVVVDTPGTQASQSFCGLVMPLATSIPAMKHPAPQLPDIHTSPLPQLVPSPIVGCLQVPAPSQLSVVHGLPSSGQLTPLPLSTTVQPPRPSHVELTWQLVAVQVKPVPVHVPDLQASPEVHACPSLHVVPSARFDHAVVEVEGIHAWHALAGLIVPDPKSVPPMSQPGPQLPALHTTPPPQLVPLGRVACPQVPEPSHVSDVQGLPSSVQVAPLDLSVIVQLVPLHVDVD